MRLPRSPILAILGNDLRLTIRRFAHRGFSAGMVIVPGLLAALMLGLHVLAAFVFSFFPHGPTWQFEAFFWVWMGWLMMVSAIVGAVEMVFERSDFDLLLSSPLAAWKILLARIVSVVLATVVWVAIFAIPMIDGAAIEWSWSFLWAYPAWMMLGIICAAVGTGFMLVLVRLFGARTARTTAQLVSVLLPSIGYLAYQGEFMVRGPAKVAIHNAGAWVFHHVPLLSMLVSAGHGSYPALLALLAITIGSLGALGGLCHRAFIIGLQDLPGALSTGRIGRQAPWKSGILKVGIRKELRLLVRDPLLLAKVGPAAIIPLMPLVLGLGRHQGLGILVIAGFFVSIIGTKALTHICADGEDAWDLIRMSPASLREVRLSKMAAGMIVPLALGLLCFLGAACAGLVTTSLAGLILSVCCAVALARLAVSRIKPTPRKDLIKKGGSRGTWRTELTAIAFLLVGCGALYGLSSANWTFQAVGWGSIVLLIVLCSVIYATVEFQEIRFPD